MGRVCRGVAVMVAGLVATGAAAWGETTELVTYYPASASAGDSHVRSLTVGTDYQSDSPGDGVALISKQLGIGTTAPGSSLEIRGAGATAATSGLNVTNSAGTSALFVRDDGKVGIGTTALDTNFTLTVTDRGAAAGHTATFTSSAPSTYIGISNTAAPTSWYLANTSAGVFEIHQPGVGARIGVLPSGNVGIGTTSPAKRLHVEEGGAAFEGGNLYIRNRAATAGAKTWGFVVNASGGLFNIGRATDSIPAGGSLARTHISMRASDNTTTLYGFVNGSDARLKRDVTPLSGVLERVASLQGVRFHWKDQPEEGRYHIGLLAQDVEKVFPDLVYTGPDGMKAIASAEYIGVLTEAVKELRTENARLEARVQALERRAR